MGSCALGSWQRLRARLAVVNSLEAFRSAAEGQSCRAAHCRALRTPINDGSVGIYTSFQALVSSRGPNRAKLHLNKCMGSIRKRNIKISSILEASQVLSGLAEIKTTDYRTSDRRRVHVRIHFAVDHFVALQQPTCGGSVMCALKPGARICVNQRLRDQRAMGHE